MNNAPPKWTFPEQLLQKFMKMPEKKLPDVSSMDSALLLLEEITGFVKGGNICAAGNAVMSPIWKQHMPQAHFTNIIYRIRREIHL